MISEQTKTELGAWLSQRDPGSVGHVDAITRWFAGFAEVKRVLGTKTTGLGHGSELQGIIRSQRLGCVTDIDGLLGRLYAHALIAPCCFDPQRDAIFVHRTERDIAARERVPGSVQGNKHWWWGAGDYGPSSPPFFKQLFGRSPQEYGDG